MSITPEIIKEEPSIVISGNTGQIAIGDNIVQEINNNCVINKISPSERPIWERGRRLSVKPRKPKIFINRTSEIQQIEDQVKAGEIIHLNGPSGIGKSTLIEYISHLVETDPFPGGLYHFSALDLKLEDLLQNIFSAFFNSNVSAIPNRSQIQNHLSEVEALILIDDLSLSKDELKVVLNIAPQCVFILVSSQMEPFSGVDNLMLKGLPEDESQTLFEQALDRNLDKKEKKLSYEICKLLNGHPDTIIQVAAKIREEELSLPEVFSDLSINSSEDLFEESLKDRSSIEQKILTFLAVVDGRMLPQEHLDGLITSDDQSIRKALDQLVARKLIQTDGVAYKLNSNVNQIVAQTFDLSPSENDLTKYFVDWSEERPAYQIPEDMFGTLLAIVRRAFHGENWSAAIKIGRVIETALFIRGYWRAWEDVLNITLESSRVLVDPKTEAWALHQLGSRLFCLDIKDQARKLLKQAASIRQEIGDMAGLKVTQHNLSMIAKVPMPTVRPSTALQSLSSVWIGIGSIVALGLVTFLGMVLYKPSSPVLNQPRNGYVEAQARELNFDWQSVFFAETYQFQFDDQDNFESPEIDSVNPSTSKTLNEVFDHGVYYWRVRGISRNDKAGKWSETWEIIISEPPLIPSLSFPDNKTIIIGANGPDLGWDSVINVKEYEVQVDDNADFSSSEFEAIIPVTGSPVTTTLEQGDYYWRVRAINEFGTEGEWSDPWQFAVSIPPGVPELSDPKTDEMIEDTTTPMLEWKAVENGTAYQVRVDDDQDFSSPEYDTVTSKTNTRVEPDLTLGDYYWQVRAINEYDTEGEWSEPWQFAVNYPPDPPELSKPVDGDLIATTQNPRLEWKSVEYGTKYTIQVDDNSNFRSPEYKTTTPETNSTVTAKLEQGDYFWRALAINEYGTEGDWSEVWEFSISIQPDVPKLIYPKAGELIEDTTTPVLDWASVENGTTYQVQVDDNQNFGSPIYNNTTSKTNSKVGTNLTTGEYYWRVRAINEYGTEGDWSTPRKFIISTKPDKPTLSSPSNNQLITSTTSPTFTWSSVPYAGRYQLQVDNSSSFSSPAYNNQNITSTNRTINVSLAQGEYYWRVRAINEYGREGDWSSTRRFNISIPPPKVSLKSPSNGQDMFLSNIPFDWYSVNNANKYQIQVDNASSFSSPIKDVKVNNSNVSFTQTALQTVCGWNTRWWRVRAINVYGTTGPWSSTWSVDIKLGCVD